MFEQIGDYKIIERVGHGGMGEVWLANKVGFQGVTSACVIKLLHRDHATDPKAREYFINEARLAAQLDHPNVVKVIDAGEAGGRLYLVMDRVDGVNLTSFLNSVRRANLPLPLDLDITCYIVGEVLTALEYAHGRTIGGRDAGVVHFDVTPNNILISSSGCVKLTDFGLSRVAAKAKNVSFIAGTPRYMSIEHHTATPRLASDIYGLGVVLHELLTDSRYHDGLEPRQIREAILHGIIPPILREDLSAWLIQLRTQMLAADYTQRPAARVALEIVLRNVPGYRRAASEIAKIYKDVVGPARSGMTKFLAAVPEQRQSFLGISIADSRPDEPTAVEAPAPEPVEVPTEPTEVLPAISQLSGLGDAASPPAQVATANVLLAPTRPDQQRALFGVAVALGTVAFVSLGWVAGTHGQREDAIVEPQRADPVAVVAEPEPSPPEITAPSLEEEEPVPTEVEPKVPAPITEAVTKAKESSVPKTPIKKEKAAAPVKVVLYIKGHDKGTIKIGGREHTVNIAASTKLAPGRYSAKWRTNTSDSWHSAGTLVVGDIAPHFYEFRLTDGSAERSERKPGKGK